MDMGMGMGMKQGPWVEVEAGQEDLRGVQVRNRGPLAPGWKVQVGEEVGIAKKGMVRLVVVQAGTEVPGLLVQYLELPIFPERASRYLYRHTPRHPRNTGRCGHCSIRRPRRYVRS
jgi:hypothetical protein